MRATDFFTVSGGATASNDRTTHVLSAAGVDRWVQLVLDDSNWVLERCAEKVSRSRKARAKIPYSGPCCFWLPAGQELYIYAMLATGSSATQWDLSVTVCEHAA